MPTVELHEPVSNTSADIRLDAGVSPGPGRAPFVGAPGGTTTTSLFIPETRGDESTIASDAAVVVVEEEEEEDRTESGMGACHCFCRCSRVAVTSNSTVSIECDDDDILCTNA